MSQPQSIGILGAAFCGSTLINVLLDGLPGVAAVGESHALVDQPDLTHLCRSCGDHCEYITPAFRDDLIADPTNWWSKWRRQMQADTIVSSDKWRGIYDRLGHPDVGLVIWKDPRSWATSWCRREKGTIENAAHVWSRCYLKTLKWLEKHQIPCVVMSLDLFLAAPEHTWERLCGLLDLPVDMGALSQIEDTHHHVRGNAGVGDGGKKWGGRLQVDERWKQALSDTDAQTIMDHPGVKTMLPKLQEYSKWQY